MICGDIVQIFSGFILQIILYFCLFRIIYITLRHFFCEVRSRRKATKKLGQTELLADHDDEPRLFDDSGDAEDVIINEDALNEDDNDETWEDEDFEDSQLLDQTFDANDSRGSGGRLNQTFDANDSRGGGRRLNQTFDANDSQGSGGRLNQTFDANDSRGGGRRLNQTFDANDSQGSGGRLNQTFDANDSRGGGRRLNQTFDANDSQGSGGRLNQTFDANDSRGGGRRLNQTFDANDSQGGGGRLNQTFDANDSRGGGRRLNQTFDANDSQGDGGRRNQTFDLNDSQSEGRLDRNIGDEDEEIIDDVNEESSDVERADHLDEESGPFPPKKERVYQDYDDILQICLDENILFEDPEFPANNGSIAYSDGKMRRLRAMRNITWTRPPDLTNEPTFFADGRPTRLNIIGNVNAGLLSGVTSMSLHPELIFKVAPRDQSFSNQYAGIFRFKFWHFGDWIEIVIDDRLPYCNNNPIFAHSKDKKEFWFPLLEKAYAKLHGSYEATELATASEVLVDLTGGIAELYETSDYRELDLFNILTRSNEMQSLMSTKANSLDVNDNIRLANQDGIYPGLVYSVTNVAKILVNKHEEDEEYSFVEFMIRLRSAWGKGFEWNGQWHDKGKEWEWVSEEDKARLEVQQLDDGEFWMSFTDFVLRFTSIEIVSLIPSSVEHSEKIPWEWTFMHGEWITGVSAGGQEYLYKNPQYRITLTTVDELKGDGKCVATISLMQKYRRSMRRLGKSEVPIGFEVYHLKRNYLRIIPVPEQFFLEANHALVICPATETREITLTVRFPPGTYLIIPFTEHISTEAEFLIRVCASSLLKLSKNDRLLRLKAKRDLLAYDELFDTYAEKFDECEEEKLSWKNLKKIMDYFGSSIPHFKGFSKETIRTAIAMIDANSDGRIDRVQYETLCGLMKHYKGYFVQFDKKKTGYLPPFTIGVIFDQLGFELNSSIEGSIVHRYGREDGSFNFDDYMLCTMKITALFAKFRDKFSKRTNVAKFALDDWLQATIFT